MNDLIENLEQLVNENKLAKANKEIEKFLLEDQVLTQKLFDKIQKVFELISQKNISTIEILLNKSLKAHLNITEYLSKIIEVINEKEFYYIYPIAKEYFIKNGLLEKFEICFKRYKKNLLKYKAYTSLILEIDSLSKLGVEIDVKISEISLAHYGQGNIEYFETEYLNALEKNKKTILTDVNIDLNDSIWRKQSFVMKEIVLRNYDQESLEGKKDFLKSIYELLLVDNEVKPCLKMLFFYCEQMGHKELAEVITSFLVNKYGENKEELDRKVLNIKEIERGTFEDIDLADDLFGGESEGQEVTIRRLVNQINMLKDERDLEGATKLLEKLKKLDKEHTLVKELGEKEHKKVGSKLSPVKKSLLEIEQDIRNELSIYCKKEEIETKEEERYLKLYTKKTVELMAIGELYSQYNELIYSYNTLGFYDSSLLAIERILSECDLSLKSRLDVLYLKVEVYRMSQNYYGALNLVEKCLEETAMVDKEKVSFYYLKGEILREIGRRTDALKAYSKVYAINKKFRMVSYRLKEIE